MRHLMVLVVLLGASCAETSGGADGTAGTGGALGAGGSAGTGGASGTAGTGGTGGAPAETLLLFPPALELGQVCAGAIARGRLELRNDGAAATTVRLEEAPPTLTAAPAELVVAPGAAATAAIFVRPDASLDPGVVAGTLLVHPDARAPLELAYRAEVARIGARLVPICAPGDPAVLPPCDAFALGETPLGTLRHAELTLVNDGCGEFELSRVTVLGATGGPSPDVRILSTPAALIEEGASLVLTFELSPAAQGPLEGVILFVSSDGADRDLELRWTAVGL